MSSYTVLSEPLELKAIFYLAVRQFWCMAKALSWVIILFVLIKDCNLFFILFTHNILFLRMLYYLQWLVMIYLGCCVLQITHNRLLGKAPWTYAKVLKTTFVPCLRVYLFFILIATVFIFLSYLGSLVHQFFLHVDHAKHHAVPMDYKYLVYFVFLSFLFSYTMIRLLFVVPLLVLNQSSLLDAAIHSNELSAHYLIRIAIYYAITLMLFLFTSQTTLFAALVAPYHLNVVLDLGLLFVILPIASTVLLLLLADLEARAHVSESG